MQHTNNLPLHLANVVDALAERDGDTPYKDGLCGVLSVALLLYVCETYPDTAVSVDVLYRIEVDKDTDEELDRVISHVMLDVGQDTLDIDGWEADERWHTHIDENLSPWHENAYNDVDYAEFTSDTLADALALFAEYGMDMSGLADLKRDIGTYGEAALKAA